MANESATVHVIGLPELIQLLDDFPAEVVAPPARKFLSRWAIATQNDARAHAPVDRGIGVNTITHEIDDSPGIPTYALVGTNNQAMRWMELGTGTLSEDPESSKRRYFPPPAALEGWAHRHKVMGGGRAVAFFIWRRGGTEPRHFLRDAAIASEAKIPGLISRFEAEMKSEADRHYRPPAGVG